MHGLNQSIKQARLPEFYKYTRLPVARWFKLSLNFESVSSLALNIINLNNLIVDYSNKINIHIKI